MNLSAAKGLQMAIFDALKGDDTLGFLLAGVYDEAPVGARYPYVSMGETSFRDGSLKTTSGVQVTFNLFVWSAEASQMEAKELMAAVETSLEEAEMTVPGFDLVTLRLDSANVIRQWSEAGSLYRGRLSYSALLYER